MHCKTQGCYTSIIDNRNLHVVILMKKNVSSSFGIDLVKCFIFCSSHITKPKKTILVKAMIVLFFICPHSTPDGVKQQEITHNHTGFGENMV